MCGNYYHNHDPACITLTDTTSTVNSTSYTLRIGVYIKSHRKIVKKPTREQLIRMKSAILHKQSFLNKNEVRPNVFKSVGYPFKRTPKTFHKNFALR
jgi:hypothetical protein